MTRTKVKGSVAAELLTKAENLADLPDKSKARENLGAMGAAPDDDVYGLRGSEYVPVAPGIADLERRIAGNEEAVTSLQGRTDLTASLQQWQLKTMIPEHKTLDDRQLGGAVSLSADGKWLAVGARYENTTTGGDTGAVYIYQRTTKGYWQQYQHIKGQQPGKQYGWTVALSSDGTTLVVGSPLAVAESKATGGAVFVLTRNDQTQQFEQQASLGFAAAAQGIAVEQFGFALALAPDGQKLFVGAWSSNMAGTDRGIVVGFKRGKTAANWTAAPVVFGDAASDRFGYSVAISGDGNRLAVGAPRMRNSRNQWVGGAKLYDIQADAGLKPLRSLQPDMTGDGWYGYSVALDHTGTTVAVGAWALDYPKMNNLSAVFVHTIADDVADDKQQQLFEPVGYNDNRFGYCVALSADGSQLFASDEYAYHASHFARIPSVFVYERDGDSYHFCQLIRAPGSYNGSNDNYPAFGRCLSLNKDTLIVGAPETRLGYYNAGVVYSYTRPRFTQPE